MMPSTLEKLLKTEVLIYSNIYINRIDPCRELSISNGLDDLSEEDLLLRYIVLALCILQLELKTEILELLKASLIFYRKDTQKSKIVAELEKRTYKRSNLLDLNENSYGSLLESLLADNSKAITQINVNYRFQLHLLRAFQAIVGIVLIATPILISVLSNLFLSLNPYGAAIGIVVPLIITGFLLVAYAGYNLEKDSKKYNKLSVISRISKIKTKLDFKNIDVDIGKQDTHNKSRSYSIDTLKSCLFKPLPESV
ncbi:MAG: hypothetical protein P1U74_11025, partial [Legionellaceae bacterium]|nr:hypothetical protein [Legionellaceae bacterium]